MQITVLLVASLLVCFPAFGQNTGSDQKTMEAVLLEIRQLRHDLQTAATAARRAQIVIYRLHEQNQVVERASEQFENSKTTLAQMEMQKQYQAEQLKRFKQLRDHAEAEQQRQQFDDMVTQFKAQLEAWEQQEQELRVKVAEAEADLRGEKAKQERLEDQLDQLDRELGETAIRASY
jgi:chromosome segregation ATPase